VGKIRFMNPETLSKPPGYSHVVEATTPGRLVYIAGQLGIDRSGQVVGDFRAQAVQTFENLKSALAAVGGSFQDVVKVNNYLIDMKDLPVFREVRNSYLGEGDLPASTTIAIAGLAREGALLEVEAVAVLRARASKAAGKSPRRAAAAKRATMASRRKKK
jgi:enamine deaminase RidA (YjgF/YER057c/UK114 family)